MDRLLLTLLIATFFSCNRRPDVKAIKQLYQQTTYDHTVIEQLPMYDSLKNIVINNIDTIFKFKNSRHFGFHSEGKDTFTIQENSNNYGFFNDPFLPENDRLETMPAFIYSPIQSIFKELTKDRIRGFTIWTDSSIHIRIKQLYVEKANADVYHELVWKTKFAEFTNQEDYYVLDTLIAPTWSYRITVGDHRGH